MDFDVISQLKVKVSCYMPNSKANKNVSKLNLEQRGRVDRRLSGGFLS